MVRTGHGEARAVEGAGPVETAAIRLKPLRYLSPFFYSDAKRVLVEGVVPWHAAVLLDAFVLLTALALFAFEAREIGTGHSPLRALLRRERRATAEA